MGEHTCRAHLPKPRKRYLGRLRACPCGQIFRCTMIGILAPRPAWIRADLFGPTSGGAQ